MRFDLSSFYSLLQAFDLTGRRTYGSDWRGDEAFARPSENPQAFREERQSIVERIKALIAEQQPHRAILAVNAGEEAHQVASVALYPIGRELDELKRRLTGLPDVTDWWVADFAAFERRRRVEDELRAAFDQGDLQLLVGPTELVQWRSWSGYADFKVYFGLSMVRVPFAHAGKRRGPAFVPKISLEPWLERFEAFDDATDILTPKARLKVWLQDKVRTCAPKERTKSAYRASAREEIPRLSARTFNLVWDQTVPDSWKKSGRRPQHSD